MKPNTARATTIEGNESNRIQRFIRLRERIQPRHAESHTLSISQMTDSDHEEASDGLFHMALAVGREMREKARGPEGKTSPEWKKLIADLDASLAAATTEEQRADIEAIRARAENLDYHDFAQDSDDEEEEDPKVMLADDLDRAGLVEMRSNTVRGMYDF